MKSDAAFQAACTVAHDREAGFVARLKSRGLHAVARSHGFRASREAIQDYAHDVDLIVEGQLCQYKHREVELAELLRRGWLPIVDEKIKAHRTPVDFYVLRFSDRTIVSPYDAEAWRGCTGIWRSELRRDEADRSLKMYYVVDPVFCVDIEDWIATMKGA